MIWLWFFLLGLIAFIFARRGVGRMRASWKDESLPTLAAGGLIAFVFFWILGFGVRSWLVAALGAAAGWLGILALTERASRRGKTSQLDRVQRLLEERERRAVRQPGEPLVYPPPRYVPPEVEDPGALEQAEEQLRRRLASEVQAEPQLVKLLKEEDYSALSTVPPPPVAEFPEPAAMVGAEAAGEAEGAAPQQRLLAALRARAGQPLPGTELTVHHGDGIDVAAAAPAAAAPAPGMAPLPRAAPMAASAPAARPGTGPVKLGQAPTAAAFGGVTLGAAPLRAAGGLQRLGRLTYEPQLVTSRLGRSVKPVKGGEEPAAEKEQAVTEKPAPAQDTAGQ